MDRQRVEWLFKKYFDKTISSVERDELMSHIDAASPEELTSLMEEVFRYQVNIRDDSFFTDGQRDKMLKGILTHIEQEVDHPTLPGRGVSMRNRLLKLSAIAAVFLLSLTFAALLYMNHSKSVDSVEMSNHAAEDIPPGGDRATLTLADGSIISLNEMEGGKIAEQAGVIITKTNEGQLVYTVTVFSEELPQADRVIPVYNTVTTPRGGQYQVVLPDGTKVWLNAESSLRYPAFFSKTERQVELVGEGYFEVARNDKAPFIVKTDDQSVRVLGTHFNINSYQKHRRTETTLLEGSVEVSSTKGDSGQSISRRLKPGEQAVVGRQSNIEVKKVKAFNAIAWKRGFFYFDDTTIENVMEELSRWYNFDFEFEGKVPSIKLWGKVYRNVNAAEALDILSYFNLKYRIVDNPKSGPRWKVVVAPM